MRCNRIAPLAAALLLSANLARAEDPKAGEEGLSAEVEIPVAVGQVLKGMRLPHYDKKDPGKLTLRFNAETAKRTSETEFSFTGLLIEVFDDSAEKPSLEVVLKTAVFDRTANQLKSIDRSKIKGEQFEIIGSQLEFDVKTRNSRLAGPVFMTITQMEEKPTP